MSGSLLAIRVQINFTELRTLRAVLAQMSRL